MKEKTEGLSVINIDDDLKLLITLALSSLVYDWNMDEETFLKFDNLMNSLGDYVSDESNIDTDLTQKEILDKLILNIGNIQEKIEAYNDVEYSE